tara:strand:- start:254 stop:400 length:147 start_codon:yes stop_codon:yes gene_type:complete
VIFSDFGFYQSYMENQLRLELKFLSQYNIKNESEKFKKYAIFAQLYFS